MLYKGLCMCEVYQTEFFFFFNLLSTTATSQPTLTRRLWWWSSGHRCSNRSTWPRMSVRERYKEKNKSFAVCCCRTQEHLDLTGQFAVTQLDLTRHDTWNPPDKSISPLKWEQWDTIFTLSITADCRHCFALVRSYMMVFWQTWEIKDIDPSLTSLPPSYSLLNCKIAWSSKSLQSQSNYSHTYFT